MLDCLILGDSIAVGIAQQRPECVSLSRGGWNTWQWNRYFGNQDLNANTVIISLGTNDHAGVNTRKELEQLRDAVSAYRVYWILPAVKPHIQAIVQEIAAANQDIVLPIRHLQRDGIHPSTKGYKDIAEKTK